MDRKRNNLLVHLARKCQTQDLTLITERCGIYVVDDEGCIPISALTEIPLSREILVELHVDLEGKWSAVFFGTFFLSTDTKILNDSIKLEEAQNASSSDREAIQTHGETIWRLFKEVMADYP